MFMFLDRTQDDIRFWTEMWQVFPEFELLSVSSCTEFWFVSVIPKYWILSHVQRICCVSVCCDFILYSVHESRTYT